MQIRGVNSCYPGGEDWTARGWRCTKPSPAGDLQNPCLFSCCARAIVYSVSVCYLRAMSFVDAALIFSCPADHVPNPGLATADITGYG